jgi:hypothetical protein
MKIMPMGDYYVWHCDWCDSTNYTIWTRIDGKKIACAACHHQFSGFTGSTMAFDRQKTADSSFNNFTL